MEKLIIDTDLGFDCDDAGALAIANKLKNAGKVEILAVTHSVNKKIGGDAICLINDYYGNGNIPVGIAERYALNVDNFYDEFYAKFHYADNFCGWAEKPTFYKILNKFDFSKYRDKEYSPAKDVIINALKQSSDGEVTIVCIGQANNVADVLNKNISLFQKKVKRVVVMCGNFNDYDYEYRLGDVFWKGEFNVLLDICSMQRLFAEKEIPIFVLDFNQGCNVLSGAPLQNQSDNPIKTAYFAHGNGVNFNLPSWDLMTVMFASGIFFDEFALSKSGSVIIDDNGKSVFTEGTGKHKLIYRKSSVCKFSSLINELLC